MRDILEHSTNLLLPTLLPQQQILNLLNPAIHKMIPRTRISIQHRRGLEELFSIRLTSLTLEGIMRVTRRLALIHKQLLKRVQCKVSFDVLGTINDAG